MSEELRQVAGHESDWTDRRVLVTGGSGFIGQHVLRELLRRGAQPCAVARREPEELLSAELAADAGQVDWRTADLCDPERARSLLESVEPDVVIHLAGMVTGSREQDLVLPMLDANLRAAVALMDAAARIDCRRFVQAGSLEEPAGPDAPVASAYAASKAGAALYARLYRDHYGLSTALARIFMVYGPGPQDENKLVPYVIRRLLDGRSVDLSAGTRRIDWIHVEDVARGVVELAASDAVQAEIGSGRLHTVREVAEALRDQIDPGARLEFGARAPRRNERERRARTSTEGSFDWCPRIDLESGLEQTIDWFRKRL